MDLNQLLHDEQRAMMRLASVITPSDPGKYHQEIARISDRLSLFRYPHRPYVAPSRAMMACASGRPPASIDRWENEGGAS